jgi:hypothetical protein
MKEDIMNPQLSQPKREGRAIWAVRYRKWQDSGQSKASFCKQHGIKTTNFYFWCAVFRKDPPSDPIDEGPTAAFVPVTIQEPAPMLSLQCGDVTLSCSAPISAERLTQWVKALRRGVCSQ